MAGVYGGERRAIARQRSLGSATLGQVKSPGAGFMAMLTLPKDSIFVAIGKSGLLRRAIAELMTTIGLYLGWAYTSHHVAPKPLPASYSA